MSDQNPFLPEEPKQNASGREFSPAGRSVDVARVFEWLKEGWRLFMRAPGMWIAVTLIMGVVMIVLGMIPVAGQLAVNFLMPVFLGGLLQGARALSQGGELRIDHLFSGFRENAGNLVLLAVFYLIGVVIIVAVTFAISGGAAMGGAMMGRGPGVGLALGGMFLAMAVMIVLFIPLGMAIWFAPALVVFRGMAPLDAMKASFAAWLKNVGPFIVTAVIVFVLFWIGMLTLGVAFVVVMPVLVGSLYASYVEIFE